MPPGKAAPKVRQELAARHVETSVYYPGPLPLMPYYRDKYGHRPGGFPHAERIAQNSIALSVGPHLGSKEMAYQAEQLKECLR
jgi:dTDP-4-amino-4,6-dideoxygalactose transaminase